MSAPVWLRVFNYPCAQCKTVGVNREGHCRPCHEAAQAQLAAPAPPTLRDTFAAAALTGCLAASAPELGLPTYENAATMAGGRWV